MRSYLRRVLMLLRRRSHPGLEELVAVATGAGEAPLLAAYHLERCARCRERAALMRKQWEEVVQASVTPSGHWRLQDGVLEELLALIATWDADFAPATAMAAQRRRAVHRAVARRLASELEAQLGSVGAALAAPAREHEAPVQAMLARSGHLLSTFLGYKAAVRLSQAALKLAGAPPKR